MEYKALAVLRISGGVQIISNQAKELGEMMGKGRSL